MQNNSKISKLVLQLYLIFCLIADIYLFCISNWEYKLYCVLIFLILMNSLANLFAKSDDYNVVFFILDLIEFTLYGLLLYAVYSNNAPAFWLFSGIIQLLYIPWNLVLIKIAAPPKYEIKNLQHYNILDGISAAISIGFCIAGFLKVIGDGFLLFASVSWIIVLFFWAKDNFPYIIGARLQLPNSKIILYDVESDCWKEVKSISVDSSGKIKNIKLSKERYTNNVSLEAEYYMLPGLIDSHVHLDQNPYGICELSPDSAYEIMKKNVAEAASAGVTAIFDVGGFQINNYYLLKKLACEDGVPHIRTTGCFFSREFGHYMAHGGFVINKQEDASLYADYLKSLGIKQAKIMLGNYEMSSDDLCGMLRNKYYTEDARIKDIVVNHYPEDSDVDIKKASRTKEFAKCLDEINSISVYSLDDLDYIVNEFKNAGIEVYAHAYTESDVDMAIDAGIKRIEHPGEYSDTLISKLKANDIIVTSTYVAAEDGALLTASQSSISSGCTHDILEKWYIDVKKVLPKLYENQVKVALGTDSGLPGTPCSSLVREIISITKIPSDNPISIKAALKSATFIAAEKIGMSDKIGKIEKEYFADFVLYQKNFLYDVNALLNPAQVWIKGTKVFESHEY